MNDAPAQVDLIAVLVAVTNGQPRVLTLENGHALPAGPLQTGHRSLQAGLREWVEAQTRHPLGYVEQLYTFAGQQPGTGRGISISYLGLSREAAGDYPGASWFGWYEYFPWEDRRAGNGPRAAALAALTAWAGRDETRAARVAALFGVQGGWQDELVLQRYELLWEARLVPEAVRATAPAGGTLVAGREMTLDHRRILATAIARLRAKIKYHPVVFELLPHEFTLLELQRTMEAIAGQSLHKPNFRRLIEQQELVEETGHVARLPAGRPAKLFRFRPAVLAERAFAGSKLPLVK
ncbi:NrtR DNA-binding winged helix domain-containing protein [Acidocella sp.]|uniref:NUDIX hydrolase n=1 Tax=Acidocella sp. TaxID=50710 RepID=UPI00262F4FA5|nr:hypothetical protein [Acidocella sp.]